MELKYISFKVALAIKKAGYPQTHGICYYIGVDEFRPMEISRQGYNYNEHISAPVYLEVWLWLYRKKKITLELLYYMSRNKWYVLLNNSQKITLKDDPEEAIIAAIEYLVDNDLIK